MIVYFYSIGIPTFGMRVIVQVGHGVSLVKTASAMQKSSVVFSFDP